MIKSYILLEQIDMLGYKSIDYLINLIIKLFPGKGESLVNPNMYQKTVNKLNYPVIPYLKVYFLIFVYMPYVLIFNTLLHTLKKEQLTFFIDKEIK